jgi:hypothetical protein
VDTNLQLTNAPGLQIRNCRDRGHQVGERRVESAWGPGAHVSSNAPKYSKTPVTACMAAAASRACLIQPLPYSAAATAKATARAAAARCRRRGADSGVGARVVLKRNAVDLVDAEYVGAGEGGRHAPEGGAAVLAGGRGRHELLHTGHHGLCLGFALHAWAFADEDSA